MQVSFFLKSYKNEFAGYSWFKFQQDVLAGLTVAAVSLPLALAFGVASGATAAAGLVASIVASVAMGLLAGAPYQVSGPTGGLVSILFITSMRHGLQGIWLAGLLAGLFLLLLGLFKLGKFFSYIPDSSITGFTSSAAFIIIIGQIDNFLGIHTTPANTFFGKLLVYFKGGFFPDWQTCVIGLMVIVIIAFWPKSWKIHFPASLASLLIATTFSMVVQWPVKNIGSIPQSLLLPDRLNMPMITWESISVILGVSISIAMLCAMESQMCGAVMATLSGIPNRINQDLISQGVGNMVLPFFGGIPSTATIIRSSMMLKSGGHTRIAGLVKGAGLLLTMFVLAPVMSRIPMAALAGLLISTAWKLNNWDRIRSYFLQPFNPAILVYLTTVLVSLATDQVKGLISGGIIAILFFLKNRATLKVETR